MTTSTKQLQEVIESMEQRIKDLEAKVESMPTPRDRGPDSTRTMTEEDAERVCYGDLKDTAHKEAAEKLGLSYGQIYSARGEYTFKQVHRKYQQQ